MIVKVDYWQSQKKLSLLWLSISGLLFILFFLQTVFGRYQNQETEAWSWLMPTILPTLSLIVSSLVTEMQQQQSTKRKCSRFLFHLTFGMSGFYLLTVIATVMIAPIAIQYTGATILGFMQKSQIWLGPLQGLVAGTLCVFFTKKTDS